MWKTRARAPFQGGVRRRASLIGICLSVFLVVRKSDGVALRPRTGTGMGWWLGRTKPINTYMAPPKEVKGGTERAIVPVPLSVEGLNHRLLLKLYEEWEREFDGGKQDLFDLENSDDPLTATVALAERLHAEYKGRDTVSYITRGGGHETNKYVELSKAGVIRTNKKTKESGTGDGSFANPSIKSIRSGDRTQNGQHVYPPHSLTNTDGIEVQARSCYSEACSNPERGEFVFKYRMLITNTGDKPVRLMSRNWTVDVLRSSINGRRRSHPPTQYQGWAGPRAPNSAVEETSMGSGESCENNSIPHLKKTMLIKDTPQDTEQKGLETECAEEGEDKYTTIVIPTGCGVHGESPVIQPGCWIEYESFATLLMTPSSRHCIAGRMHGYYTMEVVPDGEGEDTLPGSSHLGNLTVGVEPFHFILPENLGDNASEAQDVKSSSAMGGSQVQGNVGEQKPETWGQGEASSDPFAADLEAFFQKSKAERDSASRAVTVEELQSAL